MTTAIASLTSLVCACGFKPAADDPRPFRCPNSGTDDTDHVIRRELLTGERTSGSAPDPATLDELRSAFTSHQRNPFVRFRKLLHSWNAAMTGGLDDEDYLAIVDRLQRRIHHIDGGGFEVTPLERQFRLADVLGLPGDLWVKDETLNVAGSHKGRHLMGLMLWLEVMAGHDRGAFNAPLAIASCGNAALAAAVIARAAARPIQVFIPTEANPAVVAQLETLGATINRCRRADGVAGDPAYHAFREAVSAGALPFTCQGTENGLAIEGGQTLGWEMVAQLLEADVTLDHLFVQVGGGALASACIAAFEDACALGLIPRLPRIHAVQTEAAHPLCRAYQRVGGLTRKWGSGEALFHAVTHRSEFMWPWEAAPHSVATGILDDETYDWFAVIRGMLLSGGSPLIVSEERLAEANQLAARHTGVPVDPTGSAGLAGAMEFNAGGGIAPGETVAVLFTGRQR